MLKELDLPEDYDIVSVDLNESDSDAICSVSEGETNTNQHCGSADNRQPKGQEYIAITAVNAILDTGATSCCIDKKSVPSQALEKNSYTVMINGVNSRQAANWKLKGGQMMIGENKFRIPFTYSFDMTLGEGIQMVLGCNFIRSMQGGLLIEGNQATFYKNVTTIATNQSATTAIEELELNEDEYLEIQEKIFFAGVPSNTSILIKHDPLLNRLQEQGFIGEDPLKHWAKNQIMCKSDIINPDITIQDKPLSHVTPVMKQIFEKYVQALLELKVIRPSKSRHRTMAMIVQSGTSIDPKTGKEVKGKERMIFNYRALNDNTYKDQYSLLG
ncbi:uncharacterized protein LOC121978734 [Zingiber officinale]|uniref:uncharacterized protein LOC121978734 n=1 Tax=Zingiber officinale TaxID=94328 RepID=UPI001C4A7CEB|nr:uncharacterized protein LOC121978734 [Zingiber officinale]